MTTRGQFLAQVRREMAKTRGLFPARSAERPADPAALAEAIRRQLAERWPQALAKFREEFERVGGVFHRARDEDEALDTISQIARDRGAQRVVTWATSPRGLDVGPRLRTEGLEVTEEAPGGIGEVERAAFRQASAQADIGITGVDLAVAETGSLVVISGPGKARSASLLPPYHIALFGKEALVETLEQLGVIFEAIHRDPERSMSAASISFITGPSRTADIELTLTQGVHGPKEVHAVFIESR